MRISIARPRSRRLRNNQLRNKKARRRVDAAQDCRFGGAPRPWGDCGVRCGINRARSTSHGSRRCCARSSFAVLHAGLRAQCGEASDLAPPHDAQRGGTGDAEPRVAPLPTNLGITATWRMRARTDAFASLEMFDPPLHGIHRVVTPSCQIRADNRPCQRTTSACAGSAGVIVAFAACYDLGRHRGP